MKKYFSIFLLLTIIFTGCSNPTQKTQTQTETDNTIELPDCLTCREFMLSQKITYDDLPAHTPTQFDETTINSTTNNLCDGVTQKTWTFNKNNGQTSKVVTIEVDLDIATIASGTNENQFSNLKLSSIYNHALYYELENYNKIVVAATNADYFGGATPVNAFVKDSQIIKDSHNDRGIYDYTNPNADLPASMPMLFGVSGNRAQIAPMLKSGTVQETVQAKLSYGLELIRNNEKSIISDKIVINKSSDKNNINIVYNTNIKPTAYAGNIVLKLAKHDLDSTRVHGEIISIETVTETTNYIVTKDDYYIIVPETLNINDFQVGDILSYYITSPDDSWKYYDTILGCRHALVVDGGIPSTLSLETSNGAKTSGVPRTAIGVMPNGNVVIFSVEGLRYGGKSTDENDPYGLNLMELADFMRYYGVYSGANFDGGGSTQLLTRNLSTYQFEVAVRSSDYGTSGIEDSRAVINSLLVIKKGAQ